MMQNANPNTTSGSIAVNSNQSPSNLFPTAVYPKAIQQLMEAAEKQDVSKNFLGLTIMSVASTAIGNSYNLDEIIRVSPIIFAGLVGNSSTGKSPAINLAMEQIRHQERLNQNDYAARIQEYYLELAEWKQLPARDRGPHNEPPKPKFAEIVLDDITSEGLVDSLANNHKSLVFEKDELMGIVTGLQSKLENKLITVWDNKDIKYKTRSRGHEFVNKPFLNILGGIQPSVLPNFSQGNRNQNGFIYRFLFANYDEPQYDTIQKIDSLLLDNYNSIIDRLMSLEVEVDSLNRRTPQVLHLNPEASTYYQTWRTSFKKSFTPGDSAEESIVKKLENYSLRFALILQLLYWAAQEEGKDEIGMRAVKGAIQLTEHYKLNAMVVQQIIANGKQKVQHPYKEEILDMLKQNIRYKEIEAAFGVSSKTIAKIKMGG